MMLFFGCINIQISEMRFKGEVLIDTSVNHHICLPFNHPISRTYPGSPSRFSPARPCTWQVLHASRCGRGGHACVRACARACARVCLTRLSVLQVVGGAWLFSRLYCNIFVTLDVMMCTASILNLCAISIDR